MIIHGTRNLRWSCVDDGDCRDDDNDKIMADKEKWKEKRIFNFIAARERKRKIAKKKQPVFLYRFVVKMFDWWESSWCGRLKISKCGHIHVTNNAIVSYFSYFISICIRPLLSLHIKVETRSLHFCVSKVVGISVSIFPWIVSVMSTICFCFRFCLTKKNKIEGKWECQTVS